MVKKIQKNRGMTYVELIVVLGIFAVMSGIVIFNYGEFQERVDIKNLASDIALKIVEAQKSALSGKLPFPTPPSTWKPSYGVNFNSSSSYNKEFIFFANLDNDKIYDDAPLDTISIQKGIYIEKIEKCTGPTSCVLVTNPYLLSIIFTRPSSSAVLSSGVTELLGVSYIQITIKSPKAATALIKIYPSGRIQVN